MTTELISLNEYRKNISKLWKRSQEKNIRYIVLVHSKPVLEVRPIHSKIIEEVEPDKLEKIATDKYELDKKNGSLDGILVDLNNLKDEKDFISILKNNAKI